MKPLKEKIQTRTFTKNNLAVRTNYEALIAEIVSHTQPPSGRRQLAKRLAVAYHTAKWSVTDLHALLQKRLDPSIRNFSAFVNWTCKVTKK